MLILVLSCPIFRCLPPYLLLPPRPIYMASAPLLHARCAHSPRFSCSTTNRRNGGPALGSSSSSCCSSSYLAFSSGNSNYWNLLNNFNDLDFDFDFDFDFEFEFQERIIVGGIKDLELTLWRVRRISLRPPEVLLLPTRSLIIFLYLFMAFWLGMYSKDECCVWCECMQLRQ